MLSNTLLQVEAILKNQMNIMDTQTILNFLKHYRKGMWIYPNVIKRQTLLSMEKIYEMLAYMKDAGILEDYYELFCKQCQRSMGTFHKLPKFFNCKMCQIEMSTLKNAVLIYKVIKDD